MASSFGTVGNHTGAVRMKRSHFVIFKSDTQYSITECGTSGVKQAYMTDGEVSGDDSVLIRLSQVKPKHLSIRNFIENNAGHLIYGN
jgi:hypothetical protein